MITYKFSNPDGGLLSVELIIYKALETAIFVLYLINSSSTSSDWHTLIISLRI